MPDDFSTKYTFNEQEFNDAFDAIMTEKFSNKVPSQKKSAYILGGQPGAGKSSLIDNILNEKFNGNAIVISGDDFRRYHPKYDKIQKNEDKLAAKYTQNFSSKIIEKLIEHASDKDYNLIVEGTFRTETTPIKTLSLLKDKEYNTNIAIKTCDKDISWQSCLERYEKQKQVNPLTARYTTKEDHDIVIKNLSENSVKVFETGLANTILIQNRKGEKTEINFDKNLAHEHSNKIKNLIENEINSNQKIKELPNDISLTITSTQNLRPELQKIFKTGTEISKHNELSNLINILDHVDKLINIKNKNELKFANDKETIGLKIKINEEKKFDLNVPIGASNFSKGLDHLVAIGSNDLSRKQITKKDKDNYKEIVEKFGKDNSKINDNLQYSQIFDKFLNGGLQSIQAFASMGGDEMKEFSNSFIKSFQVLNISGSIKSTSQNIQANMAKDMANLDKKLKQVSENMPIKKDKEKELTNYKNLERSR